MLLRLNTGFRQRLSSTGVLRCLTMATKERQTLKDVSHTPPNGESVSAVWERGKKSETEE